MKKILLVIVALCLGSLISNAISVEVPGPIKVLIQAEYAGKIVYTTDAAIDLEPLKQDCARRGGRFNECGSVCDDRLKDTTCVTVCAATCEMDNVHMPASGMASKAMQIAEEFLTRQPFRKEYEPMSIRTSEEMDYVNVFFKRKGKVVPSEGLIRVDKETWQAKWMPQE